MPFSTDGDCSLTRQSRNQTGLIDYRCGNPISLPESSDERLCRAAPHRDEVGGVLFCFDRVVTTGTLPDTCHPRVMAGYLSYRDIRLFDYARWAGPLREEVRTNAEHLAAEAE